MLIIRVELSLILFFGLRLTSLYSQTVSDADGNIYKTVRIGTQTWMAENLKTTKYNDSTAIPLLEKDADWATTRTPAYTWYENDTSRYKKVYGALYKGYTVISNKLCPLGWHVPSDPEWIVLFDFLGGIDLAGDKMKEKGISHWANRPNTTKATNASGFTAQPGGSRGQSFGDLSFSGYFWSSTEISSGSNWSYLLDFSQRNVQREAQIKLDGLSVRCVKD